MTKKDVELDNRKIINLSIILEGEEYRKLKEVKGNITWHDFILKLIKGGLEDGRNNS